MAARPRRRGARLLLATGVLLAGAGGALLLPRTAAQSDVGPVVAPDAPLVTFLGDSWTEGVGATGLRGYAPRTAAELGWRHRELGVGGSGYSVPGPRDSTFADRVDAAARSGADVIVVQGSLNERRSSPAVLRTAALSTLRTLRDEAGPATAIVVLGASYDPGTPDATIDWINAAVHDAATQLGLRFVDVAAEDWTDRHDRRLWSGSIHLDDRGHQLVADRLAPVLRAALTGARGGGGSVPPATVRG